MEYDFPDFLRAEREKQGISLRGLARLSGVHPNTILGWEHGKVSPNLQSASWVLQALGVTYTIGSQADGQTCAEAGECCAAHDCEPCES